MIMQTAIEIDEPPQEVSKLDVQDKNCYPNSKSSNLPKFSADSSNHAYSVEYFEQQTIDPKTADATTLDQNLVVPLIQTYPPEKNCARQYTIGSVSIPHAPPGQITKEAAHKKQTTPNNTSKMSPQGKPEAPPPLDNASENCSINSSTAPASSQAGSTPPVAAGINCQMVTIAQLNPAGSKNEDLNSRPKALFNLKTTNETPGVTPSIAAYSTTSGLASTQSDAINTIPHLFEAPNQVNSNFWQQDEEERFLLGLQLYGWGQWKRIQTVVKTRTNKQIKSHAQKREKVNPAIKEKYGKGKSRRGRISSKVLAADAARGYNPAVADSMPSLDVIWKDVYGTNNGNGPNSRLRRYKNSFVHQQRLKQMHSPATGPESIQNQHQSQFKKSPQQPPNSLKQAATHAPQQCQPGFPPPPTCRTHYMPAVAPYPPTPYQLMHPLQYFPHHPYPSKLGAYLAVPPHKESIPSASPSSEAKCRPPNSSSPEYSTSSSLPVQPINESYPPGDKVARSHSTATGGTTKSASATQPPSSSSTTNTTATNTSGAKAVTNPAIPRETFHESLRPGMRVYAQQSNGRWCQGVIHSAKLDAVRSSASTPVIYSKDSNMAALLYHVHFDDQTDERSVKEEHILSKTGFESAILDLERHFALVRSGGNDSAEPWDGGTPVYAQWMDKANPKLHARWLPGTVHSSKREGDEYVYHILFDNDDEQESVPEKCILDRNEYQELLAKKNKQAIAIGLQSASYEVFGCNPFLKSSENDSTGPNNALKEGDCEKAAQKDHPSHLGLLSAVSQNSQSKSSMNEHAEISNKKRSSVATDANVAIEKNNATKKIKTPY